MNVAALTLLVALAAQSSVANATERMFEKSFTSQKRYADPFNDVDVDVVFSGKGGQWRVPTFWRGDHTWTVRFAPPEPGEYEYRLESTDRDNSALNRAGGKVVVTAYSGRNELLRRGSLRVSHNRRYLEHADGTPFYWVGDTWWTCLSDRIDWNAFRKLTADRAAKGFTVVQIVAGLIPSNEERAPVDAGFRNEGGAVWDEKFERINPKYFDYADRRVQHVIDSGMTLAIVGAWRQSLGQMGVEKMKRHWRYVVARYGAYPVVWLVGGEVVDPPKDLAAKIPPGFVDIPGGWTEVARYLKSMDPYRHLVSAHEAPPPLDLPLQDESLLDFDFIQPSHFGWPTMATAIAQLNKHYARTSVTKPVIQSEIGYEQIGSQHLEDFQRAAFWLTMLNGGAGHTYGVLDTAEAYSTDKPFHRRKWGLRTWEEGMNLPGSVQVGKAAKFLRNYPWHRLEPHPEWVKPAGTTLLDPHDSVNDFDIDLLGAAGFLDNTSTVAAPAGLPAGEWQKKGGTLQGSYAAGIPGELRIIYSVPSMWGVGASEAPTVQGLEPGVAYRSLLWDPILGVRFDLGIVQRPAPGAVLFKEQPAARSSPIREFASNAALTLAQGAPEANLVASTAGRASDVLGLAMRYQDAENFIAAVYSPADKAVFLMQQRNGTWTRRLGQVPVAQLDTNVRLTAELRDEFGIVSVTDGQRTYTSRIVSFATRFVSVETPVPGKVGVLHGGDNAPTEIEVRRSSVLATDDVLERTLKDDGGVYRGEMSGTPEWDSFARRKRILLDAYQPQLPFPQDWVLVLEKAVAPDSLQQSTTRTQR
jgi:hypothetical protein